MKRFFRSRVSTFVALALLVPALSGCVGAVVGAGAAAGIAAMEERGIDGKAKDTRIAANILGAYVQKNHQLATAIGVEVYEGRVLLTGAVPDATLRADAVRLAWGVEGVTEVFNEVQDLDASLLDSAKDSWISTQLATKLTFDKDVLSINYEIETVSAIVYLLGIAQNQAELDRVMAHARDIDGVRKIISHVRIKQVSAQK
ncbi:MAG: BON domain-containing protein, partial [Rhodospirillales bacterium]